MPVRAASVADAAQVAELFAELGYPMDEGEAARRLARGPESAFVAGDGGRLLGLMTICRQQLIVHARPTARVTALVVRSEARRRGVGAALMARAVEWAREAGCEGVELTSGKRPERAAAHRFYEGLGFERNSYRFWLRVG
jgi:GNAT superfamily N-acetyltransferase